MAKIAMLVFMLLPSSVLGQDMGEIRFKAEGAYPGYGSLTVEDPASRLRISVDASERAKQLRGVLNNGEAGDFGFTVLFRNDGYRGAFALSGDYALNLTVAEGRKGIFISESKVAVGYLDAKYFYPDGTARFSFGELLFGAKQYFDVETSFSDELLSLKAGVGAEGIGAMLIDDYGSETKMDSLSLGFRSGIGLRPSGPVKARLESELKRTRYNKDRYFFVEPWTTEINVRSEVVIDASRQVEIVPSVIYKQVDIERNRRPDMEKVETGGKVTLKDALPKRLAVFARGARGFWLHRPGSEFLFSAGVENKELSAEAYFRQETVRYSSFVLKDNAVGVQLAIRFGDAEKKKIREIDDYGRNQARSHEFYEDDGLKDIPGLTRAQQAERVRTLRKQVEWSNRNLSYAMAPDNGWGFRDADQVYRGRKGDCDEQSCHDVAMNRLNGYEAYDMNYFDYSQWVGHGVQIVKDPTNGQWFLEEYGMIFALDASSKASLEQVGYEAVKQNRFLALKVRDSVNSEYAIVDCSVPGTYRYITPFFGLAGMPQVQGRPKIEYGSELFTGRHFLLGR